MERPTRGPRRWRAPAFALLAAVLLVSSTSNGAVAAKKPKGNDLPEGYAFPVVSENVPEPLGSEHESVEIYKRAALDISMEWGIKFVYDDRCAPRVLSGEQQRLIDAGMPIPTEEEPPPPTRVFDQMYYVGLHDIAAWALVQRGGKEIYIFDALNDAEEAEQYIAGGLTELGFDPANIKAVFIMHGHRDHWGGSKYLQDTYGAKIYAGAADWPSITGPLAPARGLDIPEGPMTLGDTEVTFYETPGHTLGTISALIPLSFRGTPHLAAYWGGTGYPRRNMPLLQTYIDSMTDFTGEARRAGADVFMSNHSHSDATVPRMESINFRNPVKGAGDMVWGPEYVTGLLDVINLCARAQYAREQLPNWPFSVYGGGAWPPATATQP
jgi:metallo-beta-lactamase class B